MTSLKTAAKKTSLREERIENNVASSRHLNELEAKITTSTLNLIVLYSRMIDVIRDYGCLPMVCPGKFFWQQILHAKITFVETVPYVCQVHTDQRMRQISGEDGLCPGVQIV